MLEGCWRDVTHPQQLVTPLPTCPLCTFWGARLGGHDPNPSTHQHKRSLIKGNQINSSLCTRCNSTQCRPAPGPGRHWWALAQGALTTGHGHRGDDGTQMCPAVPGGCWQQGPALPGTWVLPASCLQAGSLIRMLMP